MLRKRILTLPLEYSILLFGARGVGKSTLLEVQFNEVNSVYINLLDLHEEERFLRDPHALIAIVEALPENITHVIIDEVQKIPRLLDVIHLLIESKKSTKCFVLTGSSARKLRSGGSNLLAGRAFVYNLFPFSILELPDGLMLVEFLSWGMLPRVFSLPTAETKEKYLQTYAQVYLKEEIWSEQIIRKLDPFRRFLEVAAQANGKIINYANIARDVGVDDKSVKNYFSILEDTLLGFMLEPYHHSFRKRLKSSPKFYFMDVGVARALARTLTVKPVKSTSYYGDLFEQFIIVECIKLASYYKSEYRFSFLNTGADVEVDLIVERPGEALLLIEIKSSENVREQDLRSMGMIMKDLDNCEAICLSCDRWAKKFGEIKVYPWREGIVKYFSNHR